MKPQRRLSELIRAGAGMRPQCKGQLFTPDWSASCALGAAIEAKYGLHAVLAEASHLFKLRNAYPVLTEDFTKLYTTGPLEGLIAYLNDDAGWTREQVADFVETCELEYETRQSGARCKAIDGQSTPRLEKPEAEQGVQISRPEPITEPQLV